MRSLFSYLSFGKCWKCPQPARSLTISPLWSVPAELAHEVFDPPTSYVLAHLSRFKFTSNSASNHELMLDGTLEII